MSEDSVRNATVIADEETDLLVISRELFNRSMKVLQHKSVYLKPDGRRVQLGVTLTMVICPLNCETEVRNSGDLYKDFILILELF